jgi:hypothetical protein
LRFVLQVRSDQTYLIHAGSHWQATVGFASAGQVPTRVPLQRQLTNLKAAPLAGPTPSRAAYYTPRPSSRTPASTASSWLSGRCSAPPPPPRLATRQAQPPRRRQHVPPSAHPAHRMSPARTASSSPTPLSQRRARIRCRRLIQCCRTRGDCDCTSQGPEISPVTPRYGLLSARGYAAEGQPPRSAPIGAVPPRRG